MLFYSFLLFLGIFFSIIFFYANCMMTTLTKTDPYIKENLLFAPWSLGMFLNHNSNLLLTICLLYFNTGLLSAIWGVGTMCVHCGSSLGRCSLLCKYTYSPHGLHCTPQVPPAWQYSELHQGWYKTLLPQEGTIMPFLTCRSLAFTSIHIIFWGWQGIPPLWRYW